MDVLSELSHYISEQEIVDFTCDLVRQKTVNPPGNEYLCKELVTKKFHEIGLKTEILEREKGRTNIIGSIGKGKPHVALIGHVDVVPAGEGWKTDPFKPVIKNGRIYGRGAADDKGPTVAAWAAVKAFIKSGLPKKGTLSLVAAADEETGSRLGLHYLVEKGFKPDYAIIPDAGKMDKIELGEKGLWWFTVTSFGKQAHGASPDKGINAIDNLAHFICALKKITWPQKQHPYFKPLTVNVGKIEGGLSPNIVPAVASCTIDLRYPLGYEKKEIQEKIVRLMRVLHEKNSAFKFKLEDLPQFSKPHLLPDTDSLAVAFVASAKHIGIKLRLGTTGGNTVAKALYFKGVSTVCHSPEQESIAHQANEFVRINNLVKSAKLYALTVHSLLESYKKK